jgi:hypothetical protein
MDTTQNNTDDNVALNRRARGAYGIMMPAFECFGASRIGVSFLIEWKALIVYRPPTA